MKKFLAILSIVILIACNKDDDAPAPIPIEENIISSWTLLDRDPDGIEVCELITQITFAENGDFEYHYAAGDDFDNCEVTDFSGSWEYLEDNKFEFILNHNNQPVIIIVEIYDNNKRLKLYYEGFPDVMEYFGRI